MSVSIHKKHIDCPYRKDVSSIILEILSNNLTLLSKQLIDIAFEIEQGCYDVCLEDAKCRNIRTNWNIYFIRIYTSITLRIIRNLDPRSDVGSTYLLDNIVSGKIQPIDIGKLQPHELCVERNEDIISHTDKQRNEKINAKVSSLYKCSKCRSSTTTVQDIQLRSLDEGSNTRITCVVCAHVWII